MYMFGPRLYLACGRIDVLDLSNWPTIAHIDTVYPNIRVREVYELGDIVVYAGRSGFGITYLGKQVSYFEDLALDRLLLFDDKFISASDGKIMVGNFTIIKPYVTCYTSDPKYLGYFPLVFTTVAECS